MDEFKILQLTASILLTTKLFWNVVPFSSVGTSKQHSITYQKSSDFHSTMVTYVKGRHKNSKDQKSTERLLSPKSITVFLQLFHLHICSCMLHRTEQEKDCVYKIQNDLEGDSCGLF
jgi:hypothetical protein